MSTSTTSPEVAALLAATTVRVEDVAASAREFFGEEAYRAIRMPSALDVDYRLKFTTPGGAEVTLHHGATAADVAAYLIRDAVPAAPAGGAR